MFRKICLKWLSFGIFVAILAGCGTALQRGMMGNVYISTARPAISLEVVDLPLMLAGRGMANMDWTGMAGGLPIQVWLAVYGAGGLAPLAITAQAQTPQGWHWDYIMRKPFSVDDRIEVFNGVEYQGCTYIVNPNMDPFLDLVTGVQPDGQPQLWLARSYAARYNFNDDKIILEYREPLPPGITSLTEMPYGNADFLVQFAQRARNAFIVAPAPANPQNVTTAYANAILWQNMGQNFLGTASQDVNLNWD